LFCGTSANLGQRLSRDRERIRDRSIIQLSDAA
jgi:hypothetical protein